MLRLKKADIILIAAVASAAAVLFVYGIVSRHVSLSAGGAVAEVLCDGKEIARYPLNEDAVYEIETEYGFNRLTIENGSVRVSDADCPGGDCTRMAPIRDGGAIVCLPHRLVINVVSDTTKEIDVIVK